MLVELSPELKEAPIRQSSFHGLTNDLKHALGVNYNASIHVLHTPSEEGVMSVSEGFLNIMSKSYSSHYALRISPHDVWFIVLTEIAALINKNAEACRSLFTKSAENIVIAVETNDITKIDLNKVEAQLRELVPVDIDQFLPEFSTITPAARYACLAAFCDGVSQYYSYMTFCCGLKAIHIDGTVNDWALLNERAEDMAVLFQGVGIDITEWMGRVQAVALRFIKALNGDSTDMIDIFSQKNVGSGGQKEISGWFKDIFQKPASQLDHFPNAWAKVTYKNIETQMEFTGIHGCFLMKQDEAGTVYGDYGEIVCYAEQLSDEDLKGLEWNERHRKTGLLQGYTPAPAPDDNV
jgi:hypothetical protein